MMISMNVITPSFVYLISGSPIGDDALPVACIVGYRPAFRTYRNSQDFRGFLLLPELRCRLSFPTECTLFNPSSAIIRRLADSLNLKMIARLIFVLLSIGFEADPIFVPQNKKQDGRLLFRSTSSKMPLANSSIGNFC